MEVLIKLELRDYLEFSALADSVFSTVQKVALVRRSLAQVANIKHPSWHRTTVRPSPSYEISYYKGFPGYIYCS